MATDTRTLIDRATSTYMLDPPSETESAAFVARVDAGTLSLSHAILEIADIANKEAAAHPVARLFFILLERAPDPTLFNAAMGALRTGSTLSDVAATGLNYLGLGLSSEDDGISNADFVNAVVNRMWGMRPFGLDLTPFVDLLDNGMTRADLLVTAAQYSDSTLLYADRMEPALLYLAASNRQATTEELNQAAGITPLTLTREILLDSGEDPFSGSPYWLIAGNTLVIQGDYQDAFAIDLSTDSALRGDSDIFQVFITRDGGITESATTFRSSLISNISRIDARQIDSDSTATMEFTGANTTFAGPVDTTITGTSANDIMSGNIGNDTLTAGEGSDVLTGGLGDDSFRFATTTAYASGAMTSILDFGNGEDTIDFSQVFGNTEPESATPISGVSDPASTEFPALNTLERNQVVVVENSGIWPTLVAGSPDIALGDVTPRTAEQIFHLFSNVTFDVTPTRGARNLVITTDPVNGADIWLIENLTQLSTIEQDEISKIGHIDSSNPDLFGLLTTDGLILA